MKQFLTEQYTNMMKMPMYGKGSGNALYLYRKAKIQNCKVIYADGSVYWEKIIFNDKFLSIKCEKKIYI